MKRNPKLKKIIIIVVVIALVLTAGGGAWYYLGHRNSDPVFVFPFMNVGMTEFWGDTKESYGPITTDRMQTVYLSNTQTVTQVFVQPGDTVKKGDVLMEFDTTLSDLALERKRLDVEKLKLQLEDAKDRLWEIRNMVPMVIPSPPETPEEPEDPDLGTPLTKPYIVASKDSFDGSTQELSMICWLNSATGIDQELFDQLHTRAQELQAKSQAQKPTTPPESGAPLEDETTGTENTTTATENTTAPVTEPTTAPTEPVTEPTDPSTEPTDPSTEPTQPTEPSTEPTEPELPEVNSFFVIFKVTEGNMSLAQRLTWQGIRVLLAPDGSYTFQFFDANTIPDSTVTDPKPIDPGPDIEIGSGFTSSQIAQMRNEQEKTIKDLEFRIKMAEADYKIMQTEVSDGKIYAEIDGTVLSLLDQEEAKITMQPFMKLSGGGGFYVEGTVSELDLATLKVGQEVTVNDWYSGMTYTGVIQSIGDYPANESSFNGMDNPNVSYYPFKVFVDGEADFMQGSYVSIQYAAGQEEGSQGVYLENPFIRTENGKSYVYVQGEDGLLEKRYVVTGRALWGSYTQILSGLSETDLIAFPYGKNVRDGAKAVEGELSDLYNY